jgi:hypothetical protein
MVDNMQRAARGGIKAILLVHFKLLKNHAMGELYRPLVSPMHWSLDGQLAPNS